MDPTTLITVIGALNWWQLILSVVVIIGIPNILNIKKIIESILPNKKHSHYDCPYYQDDEYQKIQNELVRDALQKGFVLWELREKKLVNEMMSLVEKYQIDIKSILMQDFQYVDINERDLRAYSKILDFTLNKTKKEMLTFVKENHLAARNEEEFRKYAKNTAQTLQNTHINLLNEEYYSGDFEISRKDLLEHNIKNNMSKIKTMIESMLWELRDISIKNAEKIKELENDIY